MGVELNEDQVRELVRQVVERVTARAAGPGGVLPCAIPPPGSERHEAVLRELDRRDEAKRKSCSCGCKGAPSPVPACRDLARIIDHTQLRPDACRADIERLCREAVDFKFKAVCVHPHFVPLCAGLVKGSGVLVATVVGFPLGGATTEAKAFEARDAVIRGADEIDMVINIARLKGGEADYVARDIRAVVEAADGRRVKAILETALLSDREKVAACAAAKAAGAKFVKTSTGFGPAGATVEDVALLRREVGDEMGVKAAGGVRDCATARAMLAAGASRLGASASAAIIQG